VILWIVATAEPCAAQLWPQRPQMPPLHRALGGGAAGQTVSTSPHPAVARIIVPEKDGQSYGSGTLVDVNGEHGLVVTNWHVVRDASAEITAVFPDGFRSPAQVVKVDRDWDLAALSVWRPTGCSPVSVSVEAPKPGEKLVIAGYGSGDYRAAAGICTQYLAPSERHPYELVELAAEARQGDSGGPILNERGELAGVLFGSGPGYTSGSYSGRVREFLTAVIPSMATPANTAIADNSGPAGMVPLKYEGPTQSGVGSTAPPLLPTTPVGAPAAEMAPRVPEVGMGLGPQPPLGSGALVPLNEPEMKPAEHVPLISQSASDKFESEPPLTPVRGEGDGWRKRSDDDDSNPRTAVTIDPSVRRSDDAFSSDLHSVKRPGALDSASSGALTPSESNFAAAPPSMGDRLAMVPHSPLPPRPGFQQPETAPLGTDHLALAVWQRVAGTSVWDQAKTVLAIVGVLTLLIQFWRLNHQPEPQPEAD
jgi:hypothetical protein